MARLSQLAEEQLAVQKTILVALTNGDVFQVFRQHLAPAGKRAAEALEGLGPDKY